MTTNQNLDAILELDAKIAAVRANLRDLTEQATAFSGAADESRTADRIENEEAHLAKLIAERNTLS